MSKLRNSQVVRLALFMLAGMLFGVIGVEGAYLLSPDRSMRAPEQIDLVIPAGAASAVAAGQQVQTLPPDISFVEGDTLVVRNEDSVSHQLGPVWVPPGASGKLFLQTAAEYSYACSFEPGQTFGIDVLPALTPWLRFQGYLEVGLPTGALFALYSLGMGGKKKETPA